MHDDAARKARKKRNGMKSSRVKRTSTLMVAGGGVDVRKRLACVHGMVPDPYDIVSAIGSLVAGAPVLVSTNHQAT